MAAQVPAMLHDGQGLYFQAAPGARGDSRPVRQWQFRFTSPLTGKRRWMGLGSAESVKLKEARAAADRARELVASGVDPIEQRRLEKAARAEEAAPRTFREAAEEYLVTVRGQWKNERYERLWRALFERYAYPHIGKVPVSSLDTSQQGVSFIKQVLAPVWTSKPETARRLRQRIEQVLEFASANGYRFGDNPAAQTRVRHVMGASSRAVTHRPSLPFQQIGPFLADLRALDGLGAAALELTILCATRTTETLGACWAEFDLDADQPSWTIPASRMKGRKGQVQEHRVPLSRQAAALMRRLNAGKERGAVFVFPGLGTRGPLSGMAMLSVLKRMDRRDVTVHGFRSTFRTWASERTEFPREVAEAALAHVQGDRTERAYSRGDLFHKRAALMQRWADYCDRAEQSAEVFSLSERSREAG